MHIVPVPQKLPRVLIQSRKTKIQKLRVQHLHSHKIKINDKIHDKTNDSPVPDNPQRPLPQRKLPKIPSPLPRKIKCQDSQHNIRLEVPEALDHQLQIR